MKAEELVAVFQEWHPGSTLYLDETVLASTRSNRRRHAGSSARVRMPLKGSAGDAEDVALVYVEADARFAVWDHSMEPMLRAVGLPKECVVRSDALMAFVAFVRLHTREFKPWFCDALYNTPIRHARDVSGNLIQYHDLDEEGWLLE